MCKSSIEKIKEAFGIKSTYKDEVELTREPVEETSEPEKPVEEWVWVTGYKGMDKDMKCHGGFQYELGKRYDMPEDAEVRECSNGFHMCLKLMDVFNYVDIGDDNRFFEVRALVRKSDKERYRSGTLGHGYTLVSMIGADGFTTVPATNKLAAKSIEIVRELTMDEILEPYGYHEWEEGYKKIALSTNVCAATSLMQMDTLTDHGYSRPFAQWLIDNNKYVVAKAVGSQTDLSMDMKCLMIMNGR